MMRIVVLLYLVLLAYVRPVWAEVSERVVDIPTRLGVTQRFVLLTPENPKAAVILFAGSNGGLQISPEGDFKLGKTNFLVRTRQMFAAQGFMVAVVDAPSDRQKPPYLRGFRERPEHVADIKAVIAWLKQQADIPVWLVGTSRGTESAAFIATQLSLADGGPDGLVLTATMLKDDEAWPVPDMALEKLAVPVLVVHHKQDGCKYCPYKGLPRLMKKLNGVPKKELLTLKGGKNKGEPCESLGYHGFNGIESEAIEKIAEWVISK
ncbi:MAG: alpha/beta hydrolase [Pseudomonadota bacterium]